MGRDIWDGEERIWRCIGRDGSGDGIGRERTPRGGVGLDGMGRGGIEQGVIEWDRTGGGGTAVAGTGWTRDGMGQMTCEMEWGAQY
jgi:hypothetical protein